MPAPPARALDLGSGGGVPGLVLARVWPDSTWVLLDAHTRRTAFLTEAVEQLGLTGRVVVHNGRAEEAGRSPELRASFDLVTARGFGPPAVTAECAAPLLRVGGLLVCSEPPGAPDDRWPGEPLAQVGLRTDGVLVDPVAIRRLVAVDECPSRFPRRVGVPGKRPLF